MLLGVYHALLPAIARRLKRPKSGGFLPKARIADLEPRSMDPMTTMRSIRSHSLRWPPGSAGCTATRSLQSSIASTGPEHSWRCFGSVTFSSLVRHWWLNLVLMIRKQHQLLFSECLHVVLHHAFFPDVRHARQRASPIFYLWPTPGIMASSIMAARITPYCDCNIGG